MSSYRYCYTLYCICIWCLPPCLPGKYSDRRDEMQCMFRILYSNGHIIVTLNETQYIPPVTFYFICLALPFSVIIVPSGPGIGGRAKNNVITVVRPRSFWFNTQWFILPSILTLKNARFPSSVSGAQRIYNYCRHDFLFYRVDFCRGIFNLLRNIFEKFNRPPILTLHAFAQRHCSCIVDWMVITLHYKPLLFRP